MTPEIRRHVKHEDVIESAAAEMAYWFSDNEWGNQYDHGMERGLQIAAEAIMGSKTEAMGWVDKVFTRASHIWSAGDDDDE